MPDFPIVDAHVHLWDPLRFRMPWLDNDDLLGRPFGLADYREHTAGIDVAALVYVEVDIAPAYGLLEAAWAAAQAREDPRLQGIVAWAPLEDGERVCSILDALRATSPLIKGIRRLVQAESDPAFALLPGFVRGVQLLPEYGFSCDLGIKHTQLPAIIELVRRCPDTSFILDHIGKPNVAARQFDPWREQLRELASCPNVACKVSGIVTEADRTNWTPDDLAPYVAHVLETFGEDRVLFGGDWPVVLHASPYRRWAETLDALTSGLPAEAKRKLWADNARRVYRLPAEG